jgi:glycosyltransferase involved in cell wall biosynthesis
MLSVIQVPRRFVTSDWGGTETLVQETSARLRGRGHDVEIWCPNALGGAARDELQGVPVRRFPYFYPYLGLSAASRRQLDQAGGNLFSFSLLAALRGREPLDLVHLHTGKRLGGIVRHVARRRGLPYVVSLHGGVTDVPEAEARRLASRTGGALEWGRLLGWWVGSRRVLDDAAAVVCVSAAEADLLRERLPRKRVIHLPNGVDPERFRQGDGAAFKRAHGVPLQARVVLTVGRLDPQKDQSLAIRAFGALAARHPDLHLVLLGHVTDDAYAEGLRRQVLELGLGPRVTIVPGLPAQGSGVVDAYHAADLFLLPSRHEPFGIAILEAWAAGLPVVASRVGGIPGFVVDGADGRLVAPGDEPGFVAALEGLLADPASARGLAAAGQKKARECYAWEVVTDRLLTLYEDVLREHPRRS